MRIYPRLTDEKIELLHKFESTVSKTEVFGDYSKILMPKKIEKEKTYAEINYQLSNKLGFSNQKLLFALYPYAEEVEHFGFPLGHNKFDQRTEKFVVGRLSSLTEKLAKLHEEIKDIHLGTENVVRQLSYYEDGISRRFEAFSTLFKTGHEFTKSWDANFHRIKNSCEEHKDWQLKHKKNRSDGKTVLFDLHPLNAFFRKRKEECALIFDYEGFSRNYDEDDALAFTIHRFSREYLRTIDNDTQRKSSLVKIVNSMIDTYCNEGGNLSGDFKESLGKLIRVTNIGKLLDCLFYLTRGNDPMQRSMDIHDSEACKFLMMLKESEFYENL